MGGGDRGVGMEGGAGVDIRGDCMKWWICKRTVSCVNICHFMQVKQTNLHTNLISCTVIDQHQSTPILVLQTTQRN